LEILYINFFIIPGVIRIISDIGLYVTSYTLLVMALLPTNEYKPFEPRARWRKWIGKHIEQPLYKAVNKVKWTII
jgi:hypothetical protein